MRERPIIMSAPMVRALLTGAKSQTRRLVKGLQLGERPECVDQFTGALITTFSPLTPCDGRIISCPYGSFAFRDRLWVRETWLQWDPEDLGVEPQDPATLRFRADGEIPAVRWRSSMFMPRWASRITLEVIDVRVQRLQEITEADAIAEGLSRITKDDGRTWKYGIPDRDGLPGTDNIGWPWSKWNTDPRQAYATLWSSIHARDPVHSWEANPWVWVVSFRRIEPAAVEEARASL